MPRDVVIALPPSVALPDVDDERTLRAAAARALRVAPEKLSARKKTQAKTTAQNVANQLVAWKSFL